MGYLQQVLTQKRNFMKTSSNNQNTPKVIIYGKLGTFKKVETVLNAVQEIRNIYGTNTEVVVAGTDSHMAPGYVDSVQLKYQNMSGVHFIGDVSQKELTEIMAHNVVVNFPYTIGGTGNVYKVPHQIYSTMAHKMNNFRDLAVEKGYPRANFNSDSDVSLADAIYQMLAVDMLQTA